MAHKGCRPTLNAGRWVGDRWGSPGVAAAAMKILILLLVVLGSGLAGWIAWQRTPRKHDPVEYFSGWDGYELPIRLTGRITKDEADAIAARGNAYLIGYFDGDNRLVRNV